MKRLFSFLLAFSVLCSACTRGHRTEREAPSHTDLSFAELTESGEDVGLALARAGELVFRIERGELSGLCAQEALDAHLASYERLRTDAALAYVRYCLDVTDPEARQRYDALSVKLDALACVLTDAALLLSRDPALSDRYDAETVDRLLREDALSDLSLQPLLARERELVGQYEALPETLFAERNGRRWTGDQILSDPTLSDADFAALYEQYMSLFNREAGKICLQLLEVRNEIADALGFDTYAAYAYACMDRSFSPEDAASFSENVKRDFVPLFQRIGEDFYAAAGRLYGAVFEQGPTMERIRDAIVSLVPELEEPWEYMIAHSMLDLETEVNRMPCSFTTYFASYGTPFLFSSWTNGFDMPPTVIHEFGHFSAFYLNGDVLKTGNPPDLAEIDAQGLELLTVLRYDTIYGDLSRAAETAQLFYALYALLDGCLEDEFQRFAYENGEMSVDRLNAEYGRLLKAYGMDALGIDPRAWTQIPHTFRLPYYYISYAVSMAAALELYLIATHDPDAAARAYRGILQRSGADLAETLKCAGLRDPFSADDLHKTAYELGSVRRFSNNE